MKNIQLSAESAKCLNTGKWMTLLMVMLLSIGASAQTQTDDLDKYLGVYSSGDVPLKFTLTRDGDVLVAQGTGQTPVRLEKTGQGKFKNEKLGMVVEFSPAKGEFTLKQSGGTFLYKKDIVQRLEPAFDPKQK